MSALSSTNPPATPILMTAEEFTDRYTSIHAELIKGVVKEYPLPFVKHGVICLRIGRLIGNHVDAHDLGLVASNDSWIRTGTNPDTVRGADVCFFSYARLPKGDIPKGQLPVSPDLVVEVRSPSDRWTNVLAKVSEYLAAGVRVVLVLDPDVHSAWLYRDDAFPQTLHNGDELTLPDVLPGFAVTVSSLYG